MSSSTNSVYTAPAKVNLSLRIRGEREDGYHEIDTVMARLDLADELGFHNSRTTTLLCDAPDMATDESNLVMRAVREFEKSYGRKVKQRITLTKRVPMAAGLGGGSADAAITLLALNERLGTQYDAEELAAMAAAVGSDVAFFLSSGICRCTGRGEQVRPLPQFAGWTSPIVLLKPRFGVSTKRTYEAYESTRRQPGFSYQMQVVDGLRLCNDLERPVFAKFPFLGMMKNWMLARPGVRAALMSGSGSTMFALTETPEQARRLAQDALAELDSTLYTYCGVVNPQ